MAGDWRVTGGVLKIVRRIWEVGVAGSPVIGRRRGPGGRSQHYCGGPDCGLPLVAFWQQKSERKMLASTYACTSSMPGFTLISYVFYL